MSEADRLMAEILREAHRVAWGRTWHSYVFGDYYAPAGGPPPEWWKGLSAVLEDTTE